MICSLSANDKTVVVAAANAATAVISDTLLTLRQVRDRQRERRRVIKNGLSLLISAKWEQKTTPTTTAATIMDWPPIQMMITGVRLMFTRYPQWTNKADNNNWQKQ